MLQYSDTQVEIMASTERSEKTKTAFKLFDKNKDGFITRQEFLKVCRKMTATAVYGRAESRNL